MKKFKLTSILLGISVIFGLLACHHPAPPSPNMNIKVDAFALFGSTPQEIMKLESNKGAKVEEKSKLRQVWASIDKQQHIYYFDKSNKLQLVEVQLTNAAELTASTAKLISSYKLENSKEAVKGNEVKYFENANIVVSTYNFKEKFGYVIGKKDESNNSWTRRTILKDSKSNIWMPILGKYAPIITMEIFEAAQGHTLNTELTKMDKGVYVYNTNDTKYPMVKYWFDIEVKSFLEESAVFIDANNRPTPVEINEWLVQLNFKKTILADENDNPVYFNKANMCSAVVEMNKPKQKDAPFVPKVQFFFKDLTEKLPAENISFPMPILEFNKFTMEEIIEQYKKQAYFVSTSKNELGTLINTNSPEFKGILIMEDKGKYAMAFTLAENLQIINSPEIVEILKKNGFVEKKVGAIPTFINDEKDVQAQIDAAGLFGSYSVAFSKKEF